MLYCTVFFFAEPSIKSHWNCKILAERMELLILERKNFYEKIKVNKYLNAKMEELGLEKW